MPPNPDSEAEAAGGEGLRGSCRQSLKEEKASPPRSPSQRSLPDEAFSAEDATAPEDEARGEEQRETDGLCEGEAGQRSENERKEAKRDDCWSHDSQPPMTGPQVVQYCILCGFPPEYCEFSDKACGSKAKKELQSQPPPPPSGESFSFGKEQEALLTAELSSKATLAEAKRGAGAKKTQGEKPAVLTVQKQKKRRKHVTLLWGLEAFGVKPEQVARLAAKHFACGASAQKEAAGQPPCVEIQGDVQDQLPAFLQTRFEINPDKIVTLPEKC